MDETAQAFTYICDVCLLGGVIGTLHYQRVPLQNSLGEVKKKIPLKNQCKNRMYMQSTYNCMKLLNYYY